MNYGIVIVLFVILVLTGDAVRAETTADVRQPAASSPECGIDWDAKIDSSDGFVKLRATNTCDFSVGFIVAVYHTDGTVNRTRNYCYAPKQTGVVTIGKGDWIQRVAVESVYRC
jgi:hypothetical protein